METSKMSEREVRCADLAYRSAAEGMVLLENNGALPIEKSGRIALFGMGAVRTVRGGTGSGDPFNGGLSGGGRADVDQYPRYHIHILDAFEAAGYEVTTADSLREEAVSYDDDKSHMRMGLGTFLFPEPVIGEDLIKTSKVNCETALFIITRNSGEGDDRHMYGTDADKNESKEIGDYLLSDIEKSNLQLVRKNFKKVIVVLNVGGIIDMTDIRSAQPDAILLMSLAGQEGGRAVRDVLNGTFNPSGKLTDTWAAIYSDYPASESFGAEDRDINVEKYKEGIFVGYRYFDMKNTKAVYPFGYGLSYTSFEITDEKLSLDGDTAVIRCMVRNTGNAAGREVVQVYTKICPETKISQPVKILTGFAKTRLLTAGESEELEIKVEMKDLATFIDDPSVVTSDGKDCVDGCSQKTQDHQCSYEHGYTLLAGDYIFMLGNCSDALDKIGRIRVNESKTVSIVTSILPVEKDFKEPVQYNILGEDEELTAIEYKPHFETTDLRYKVDKVNTYLMHDGYQAVLDYDYPVHYKKEKILFQDVLDGKATMEMFVAQLSDEQLACINTGTGWGVADENSPIIGANSESVPGAAGETTRILEDEYGVPSIVMADGPGGVRVKQEFEATNEATGEKELVTHYATAWPVGTLLAQSFDLELMKQVGRAFAEEMVDIGVAIILGPGMNIHRDPLCGRNFEYFSEDPLLTGLMGSAFTNGLQETKGLGACIKHFAANNQETNRHAVDEIIGERALREIYLRGFEIAVKQSHPWCIMTAYNQINHVPCGDSLDLCNVVARNEWGFDGMIMTDWNGGSSTASISMHAGNDMIMPGGPSKQKEILLAFHHIESAFDERGQILMTKPVDIMPFYEANWNSFVPDRAGKDSVSVTLTGEHKASMVDDKLLVDGEPVYMKETDKFEYFKRKGVFPFDAPATSEDAEVSEDGKTITYHGRRNDQHTITRGDLQACAMNVLNIVARASK